MQIYMEIKPYEVYGNIGEVEYLSFGIKENRYSKDGTMVSLGEIDIKDMNVSDDSGDFILYRRRK